MFRQAKIKLAIPLLLPSLLLLNACSGGVGAQGDGVDPNLDPNVANVSIAFIKRPAPVDQNGNLVRDDLARPYAFNPGARLYIKGSTSISGQERIITDIAANGGAQGLYDVKDLSVSRDGRKLLFAMRAPEIEDAQPEDQPTWNIWLYDTTATQALRRVIGSDINAEAGQDYAPEFLPAANGEADARIVFVSTRQRNSRATLTDEGRGQYSGLAEGSNVEAAVLHVMDIDGTNINQISFNASHDYDPVVLSSGKILFGRWDRKGGNQGINLYQINADGSGFDYQYGRHSHNSATGANSNARVYLTKLQQLPDDRILTIKRPFSTSRYGGDLVTVDVENFSELNIATADSGASGSAEASLVGDVYTDGSISLGGNYAAFAGLNDSTGRYLLSWDQCSLAQVSGSIPCTASNIQQDGVQQANPAYGLWLFDPARQIRLPVVIAQVNSVISDVVTLQDQNTSIGLTGVNIDTGLESQQLGLVDIRSVYDMAGVSSQPLAVLADPAQTSASARPAHFLRIVKPLMRPSNDVLQNVADSFGRGQGVLRDFREIIGYVPVEPDGSAKFAVPANVPFSLSIVDSQGRRTSARHNQWMQVQAGETLSCNGCHAGNNTTAHGRVDAEPGSANLGLAAIGGVFPNTLASLFGDPEETMAQVSHLRLGLTKPDMNLIYQDVWTDENSATVSPGYSFRYRWLGDVADQMLSDYVLPAGVGANNIPTLASCEQKWEVNCRITINYVDHIQPIWTRAREVERAGVMEDVTCTNSGCHNSVNDMSNAQLAAGQLDLTALGTAILPLSFEGFVNSQSVACVLSGRLASYCELLNADYAVIVDENGTLTPALRDPSDPNEFITAVELLAMLEELQNADPPDPQAVLDFLVLIPSLLDDLSPVLNGNGALASQGFFNRLDSYNSLVDSFDHRDIMSPAEKRLLYEWLDLGAQYRNDPF